MCRALQTERTELLTELKQLRGSDDAEENNEQNLYDEDSQDKVLDDQKCGSPDQSEEIIHTTLSDGVGMSHDSEAASHDLHEDGSHDPVHMIHMKMAHMIWWQNRRHHHQRSQPIRMRVDITD